MAVTEPPGDFDYQWEDLGDPDEALEFEEFDVRPHPAPPARWYRTPAAVMAIGAIAIGVVAILVSAALLVSRHSDGPATRVEITTATTPRPSPTATTPPMISAVPPSPTETPAPNEPTASAPSEPTADAPVGAPVVVTPPPHQPVASKPPEIGVTRSPVTRSPISVRPQPRLGFPHN